MTLWIQSLSFLIQIPLGLTYFSLAVLLFTLSGWQECLLQSQVILGIGGRTAKFITSSDQPSRIKETIVLNSKPGGMDCLGSWPNSIGKSIC